MAWSNCGRAPCASPLLKSCTPSLKARTAICSLKDSAAGKSVGHRMTAIVKIQETRLNIEGPPSAASFAGADVAQIVVGVDAGIVTVAPAKVEGVVPHHVDCRGLDPRRDGIRIYERFVRPFIDAGGAAAGQAQIARLIRALVGVAPYDRHSTFFGFYALRDRFRHVRTHFPARAPDRRECPERKFANGHAAPC